MVLIDKAFNKWISSIFKFLFSEIEKNVTFGLKICVDIFKFFYFFVHFQSFLCAVFVLVYLRMTEFSLLKKSENIRSISHSHMTENERAHNLFNFSWKIIEYKNQNKKNIYKMLYRNFRTYTYHFYRILILRTTFLIFKKINIYWKNVSVFPITGFQKIKCPLRDFEEVCNVFFWTF